MRLLCSLLCGGGKQDGSIGAITKTDEAAKIWIFLFFKKKIKGKWKHLFFVNGCGHLQVLPVGLFVNIFFQYFDGG